MRGRSVGAEPMTGGVVCVVDARGLAEERGLGDGLHILHDLYLNLRFLVRRRLTRLRRVSSASNVGLYHTGIH